ncbi:MAG TPA: ankyrin repeat domain-containing protein [Verrucomicrobiae bacterium]|nr:ankyrin repeat domain-containing protein [Verrucomicrobiae bacterium]
MKTKLCIGMILLAATLLRAETTNLTALLQQGLLEEQASRNLDAAIADYQTLAAQFDKDRQLAATAVFRLGECYRAQGKTAEAAAQYQRILRDFSDQTTLATLSRQDLAGLGMSRSDSPKAEAPSAVENPEAQLYKKLQDRPVSDLEKILPTVAPDATLDDLLAKRNESQARRATLAVDYSPQSIEVTRVDATLAVLNKQIEDRITGIMTGLKLRAELPASSSSGKRSDLLDLSVPADSEEDQEIARIQKMIQNSPDLINAPAEGGSTPLSNAAYKGWLKVADYLIDHGADVNFKTPLNTAAWAGNRTMVELLLRRGAGVNSKDSQKKTPLFMAVEKKYPAVIEVLLANKADVNAQDEKGRTVLYSAVENDDVKTVQSLLEAGIDPNLKSSNGRSALSAAASLRLPEIVKILLAAKADPNGDTFGSPLIAAILGNDPVSVEKLLQAGANPNVQAQQVFSSGGWSRSAAPLAVAISKDMPSTVTLLLKFKADPDGAQTDEHTFLFGALHDTNILEALLAAGAKVDPVSPDEQEWTPLGAAVDQNFVSAVAILLKHGANPNVSNRNGVRPLHHAVYHLVDTNIFEMLFAAGADPNVRTGNGQTPLDVMKEQQVRSENSAVQKERAAELAALLRRHGALDDLPYWNRIRITRAGLPHPIEAFHDGKLANQFTLLETVARFYSLQQINFAGQGTRAAWDGLPFPDFGRMIIWRPSLKTGEKPQEIKVSLLNNSNVIDCTLDVPVKFGDVIEIPESNHPLNAVKPNPAQALNLAAGIAGPGITFQERIRGLEANGPADTYRAAAKCLQKTVQLVVAGQPTTLLIDSWSVGFLKEALDKTEAKSVLRSSSDLSHVKVTRKNGSLGGSEVFTVDVAGGSSDADLWLQTGDVIEVPEKP